jgi:two-component system alkaline phosphatase synthesis response regulator PhoP/two-component system response regulator RpaA
MITQEIATRPANIIIIEDDDLVARTVERSLRSEYFKIAVVDNGEAGLRLARKRPPDLVILDVIMPGMDGFEVCRAMRGDRQLADVPILFLTAKIKDEDRINGFLAGADDYLTKPFNIDELLLRVRAILRRTQTQATSHVQSESIAAEQLDPDARKIVEEILARTKSSSAYRPLVAGAYVLDTQSYELHTPARGVVRLTPIQYDLVSHLMSHPGEIFSPARLLDEVWGYPVDIGSPDLVRVHIKKLRERVETDPGAPAFIRTVPGFGYTTGPASPSE